MHSKQTLCKSAESPLRSLVDWINCSCSVHPTNAPANLPHSCGPHVATLTPRTSSSGASTRMNIWDRPAGQLWLWSYGIGRYERQVHYIVGIVVTSIVRGCIQIPHAPNSWTHVVPWCVQCHHVKPASDADRQAWRLRWWNQSGQHSRLADFLRARLQSLQPKKKMTLFRLVIWHTWQLDQLDVVF